jgi:hypothetical protein
VIPQALADFIDYGANVAFWASVGFFLSTSVIWPWWRSFWGVNIIALEGALGLALLPFIMSYDFGVRIVSSLVFAWVEGVSLWLIGIIIVWRGFLVVSQQLRGAVGVNLPGAAQEAARLRVLRARRRVKERADRETADSPRKG